MYNQIVINSVDCKYGKREFCTKKEMLINQSPYSNLFSQLIAYKYFSTTLFSLFIQKLVINVAEYLIYKFSARVAQAHGSVVVKAEGDVDLGGLRNSGSLVVKSEGTVNNAARSGRAGSTSITDRHSRRRLFSFY